MNTQISRAIALCAVFFTCNAGAADPGDKVTRDQNGKITITSVVMAPNSCYSAGPSAVGSPQDATAIDNAILITQPLGHSSGMMCLMMLKPVTFTLTTEVPDGAQAIVVYSLNEKTKSVTARALAIPAM